MVITRSIIQLAHLGRFTSEPLSTFARYLYSGAYLGVDEFVKTRNYIKKEYCHQMLLKTFQLKQALTKPDGIILTGDLKVVLYAARENDIDFLVDLIKRYKTQSKEAGFNFNYKTPFMHLLYVNRKVDKALELYLSKDNIFECQYRPTITLMNMLVKMRRNDDVIKVYNHFRNYHEKNPVANTSYFQLFSLVTEALYEMNTPEALKQYKEILKDPFYTSGNNINDGNYMKMCLLALNQKDPEFAYELIEKIKRRPPHVVKNLTVLALIQMNRLSEALLMAEDLKQSTNQSKYTAVFFQTTLEKLSEATEAENRADEHKRVCTLIESAMKDRNFLVTDIESYVKASDESRSTNEEKPIVESRDAADEPKSIRKPIFEIRERKDFRNEKK